MIYLELFVLIQIIFEALPVSSSGHLILFNYFFNKLGLEIPIIPNYFDHFLHGFTALSIAYVFFDVWKNPTMIFFKSIFRLNFFGFKERRVLSAFLKIIGFVFIIDGITILFYLLFNFLDQFFLFTNKLSLLLGFFVTSFTLFLTLMKKNISKDSYETLSFSKSIIIGIFQGIAFIPGISRFATTYSCAVFLNICPRRAMQISFLIHFPICIAGFVQGIYGLLKYKIETILYFQILLVVIIATIISTILLTLVYKLAQTGNLWLFSFYMVVPILLLCKIIFS